MSFTAASIFFLTNLIKSTLLGILNVGSNMKILSQRTVYIKHYTSLYTVEEGAGVCLDFFKTNSFYVYVIKKGSSSICASLDEQPIFFFANNFGNESSFNCSVSRTIMSVCIWNFQPEDAGTYSLHDGLTTSSNLLKSITLVKASKSSLIPDKVLLVSMNKYHPKSMINVQKKI